jgi:two-component system phosphate regulon sensor histidine kinase PhoR
MNFSRLFWKQFLGAAVPIVVSAIALATLVSRWQQNQSYDQLDRRLSDVAYVLREFAEKGLESLTTVQLQQLADEMSAGTGNRITFIDAQGVVLADSDEDYRLMENHADRAELREAARHGEGRARRFSATLQQSMYYYATKLSRDSEDAGFVRLSLALTSVDRELEKMHRVIWLVAAAVGFCALVLNYWWARRTLEPVASLQRAAQTLMAGDYDQRVNVSTRDELGDLATTFNEMSREMAAREKQLRQTADRLSTVLSGMVEGIIAVDSNERILFANEAAGTLLGFSTDQAVNQSLMDVVRHPELHNVVADLLAVHSDQPATRRHVEISLGASDEQTLGVNATRLPGKPSPGAVIVLQDITQLQRLENLRQEFSANVSHELKTPLSSILAYTETLRAGAIQDSENNLRFVEQIHKQAERLNYLIHDLLSLARIESGKEAMEIKPVPILPMVKTSISDWAGATAARRISIVSSDGHSDMCVLSDEEALRQILDNLIDNAVKYSPDGGQVRVTWRRVDDRAVIEVSDQGPGIAPEHQQRIFERFYRVDRARSREIGGTGLGLSIVKHLSQAMNGEVEVASIVGEGTTLKVTLPVA